MSIDTYKHYTDQQSLDLHIQRYHKTNPISDYLQEIVYGGSDGIVTTLAVISGFAGAGSGNLGLTTSIVLLFGFANLCADGVSMGLGNFLSVRSEKAVGKRQYDMQQKELTDNVAASVESLELLLRKKGYSTDTATQLASLITQNPTHQLEFMLQEEVGLSNSYKENSWISSLFTFFSFILFGSLPLIPYMISTHVLSGMYQFGLSVFAATIALVILGIVRRFTTHESWIRSVGETVFVGGVSTSIAFVVGVLFS